MLMFPTFEDLSQSNENSLLQTIQFPFMQRKVYVFLAKQCRVEHSPVYSTVGLNMEKINQIWNKVIVFLNR